MMRSRVAAGAAAALLGPLMSGCTGQSTRSSTPCLVQKASTALAIGARSNSPAPQLPDNVDNLLQGAADAEQQITIIRLDGDPRQVFGERFTPKTRNSAGRKDELGQFVTEINRVLAGSKVKDADISSQAPEADVLRALTLAAQSTSPGGNVILVDSGLQTTAPLDFRQGLLQTEPDTVVDYLKRMQELPDLSGRHVLLAGLGETAPPQAKLDNRLHSKVVAIWQKITAAAGASCVSTPPLPYRDALPGLPPVSQVTLPPVPQPPAPCTTRSYGEPDNVGFLSDSATFRTPDAARATLERLADVMRTGDQTVTLTGATSSEGDESHNQALSEARAGAVKQVLIGFGIAADRITANGVGEHLPGRLTDVDSNGKLLLGPAVQNREVIAKLAGKACPSS